MAESEDIPSNQVMCINNKLCATCLEAEKIFALVGLAFAFERDRS